jgi:hypothetical protein
MNLRRVIAAFGAGALLVLGSLLWLSRTKTPDVNVFVEKLGAALETASAGQEARLLSACKAVNSSGGWLVFVATMNLQSDDVPRRYLQTADEPYGLFIEYDPTESGLLRLGLGLGPDKWNTELPIRTVRRNESTQIFIGISREETRVVTSVVDRRIQWPGEFVDEWRCDNMKLGIDQEVPGSLMYCKNCQVRLEFLEGTGTATMQTALDAMSNIQTYQFARISGSLLSAVGLGLLGWAIRRRS